MPRGAKSAATPNEGAAAADNDLSMEERIAEARAADDAALNAMEERLEEAREARAVTTPDLPDTAAELPTVGQLMLAGMPAAAVVHGVRVNLSGRFPLSHLSSVDMAQWEQLGFGARVILNDVRAVVVDSKLHLTLTPEGEDRERTVAASLKVLRIGAAIEPDPQSRNEAVLALREAQEALASVDERREALIEEALERLTRVVQALLVPDDDDAGEDE